MATASNSRAVDFSHQVVPLLKKHCAECHTGEKKKGGFSMNDRPLLMAGGENGKVVEPGHAEKSKLIEVILSHDPDEQMPPKGDRVPAEGVEVLKAWINEGAPWEEGFAFRKPTYEPPLKPRRPNLPAAVAGRANPIDRIIDAYLAEHHLPRPQSLDDAAFLRRIYLDLVGLLPTSEALQKFLADPSPNKRAAMAKTLLADDIDYADHWLSFWNDLLRNDYIGAGFTTGGRRQITHWLYAALVANMPYDQFTRELIAPPTVESQGYIDGIKWRGEVSAAQTLEVQFAQSISQTFLGINMKCASCHDSFIDRWKLTDAYGLAAIYSKRELDIARCDKATGQKAVAAWLFPELGGVDAKAPQPERLKQLAALMTHPDNGRFTRTIVNRLWQRFMGRGIVHPVDAMQTEPWSADLLDFLAVDFADRGYDLRKTMELIVTSQAYQSQSQVTPKGADDHGYVYAGPRAKRFTAEQFVDTLWQMTDGAPAKFDAPVVRGKADVAAALTSKVTAQWIWGDSAKNGQLPPSDESIGLRKVVKLPQAPDQASAIVTCDNAFVLYLNNREVTRSDNWERPVAVPLTGLLKAGNNTFVAIATNKGKGPNAAGFYMEVRIHYPDKTESELVTDGTWQWSATPPDLKEGHLVDAAKAPWQEGVTVVKPLAAWAKVIKAETPKLMVGLMVAEDGRMVRSSLLKTNLLLRSLGRPNREQIVSMRPSELTTLEALDLSNGQILTDLLAKGAQKMAAQHWASVDALVDHLYNFALSRKPSPGEAAAMRESFGDKVTPQGIQDALWAICMMPEFQYVR